MRRSDRMKRILRERWGYFLAPRSNRGDGVQYFGDLLHEASHEKRNRSSNHPGGGRRSRYRPFGPDSLLAQSPIFKSGVELVPLTVTVTDRAGRYVPDLTPADFAIFEEDSGRAFRTSPRAMRRSIWGSSSTPAGAWGTTCPWRRKRRADSFNNSGRVIVRPSLESGRPSRSISHDAGSGARR